MYGPTLDPRYLTVWPTVLESREFAVHYDLNRVVEISMSLRLSAPMLCDDAIDGGPVDEIAPKYHGVDPLNIPNIRQGIGIEQH